MRFGARWAYKNKDRGADWVVAARESAAAEEEKRGGERGARFPREGGLQRHQRTHRRPWKRFVGGMVGENGTVRRRDGLLTARRRRSSL